MSQHLVRRVGSGLLARLLDEPDLVPALRALPAPALRRMILEVGLEDSGELVALARLEQLREVFDEDLWRSAIPGEDEAFDAARFVTWIEVLHEGGDAFVANRLAELSEDFLVFAVSQLVRVLDLAVLRTWATDSDEAERLDRLVDTHLCQDFDDLLVVARGERGWDAVLAILLAFDEHHPSLLRGVLERCAAASHEVLQGTDDLYDVLEGEEVLLEDARAERDARRAESGYVAPSDARAFLALACTAPASPARDPVTHAHFRELDPGAASEPADVAGPAAAGAPASLHRLLVAAGAEAHGVAQAPDATHSLFRRALESLAADDPEAQATRLQELAYLANVLIAGDTARAWGPVEAAEHVLALCDEGLRSVEGADPDLAHARSLVRRWGPVGLFRIAWSARHGEA